jgi:hypothetical protein
MPVAAPPGVCQVLDYSNLTQPKLSGITYHSHSMPFVSIVAQGLASGCLTDQCVQGAVLSWSGWTAFTQQNCQLSRDVVATIGTQPQF